MVFESDDNTPHILFQRQRTIPLGCKHLVLPRRSLPDDAGMDIFCLHDTVLWPWSCKDIPSGWNVKIPDGYWGTIKPRSSTFKRRRLVVFEGVIDPNYTGSLSVLVWNPSFVPRIVRAGERLGQLIVVPMLYHPALVVDSMPPTSRGTKGWGHSGR